MRTNATFGEVLSVDELRGAKVDQVHMADRLHCAGKLWLKCSLYFAFIGASTRYGMWTHAKNIYMAKLAERAGGTADSDLMQYLIVT